MILGLDTATAATTVALMGSDGEAIEARDDPPAGERPRHASRLLALAEEVLVLAGAGWPDVSRLAVGVGPGSFTGLRIGVATARALAQAHHLPLVPVSSLAALALAAQEDDEDALVMPVIDARRGEVFLAAYGGREARMAPAVATPEELAARVAGLGSTPLSVGDGAVRFRAQLEAAGARVAPGDSRLHRLSAVQVCRLGAGAEPADRDALLPDYLRAPDAVPRTR